MATWKTYKLGDITIMRNGKKRPNTQGTYPVYGGNGIMDYADCYNAENTIIVGRVGAYCGNVYQCKGKCWVSDNAISVSANEYVDSKYLFMVAKNIKEELVNKAIGSAQQNISQVIIKDIDISSDIEKIKQFHKIVCPHFEVMEKNQKENETLATLRDTLLPKLMNGEIKI